MAKKELDQIDWQEDISYTESRIKKIAMFFAILGWSLAMILGIALVALVPLKSVEPIFIRVNDATGVVDVYETLDNRKIDSTEAMEKAFMYRYMNAREGYLFQTYAKDYELVNLMSIGTAKKEYNKIALDEDHPENPFNKYEDKMEVRIKIISISITISQGNKSASIRYTKEERENGEQISKVNFIATASFEYVTRTVTEKLRLRNPLDFVILQYRTDKETL